MCPQYNCSASFNTETRSTQMALRSWSIIRITTCCIELKNSVFSVFSVSLC